MARETSQTLDRGLRVLELLAEAPDGLTVTEIAQRLGVSRTVVYRLVVTLEEHGLLRRGSDGRARTGLAVLTLARHVQPLLREAAAPILRRLSEATGCTSLLVVAEGEDGLVVTVVEPSHAELHVAVRVGARTALDRVPGGRAVLAARHHRPLDQGWIVTSGEPERGAWSLGVPLPPVPGVEAAVAVVHVGPEDAARVGPATLEAASEVSRALR